MNLINDLDVIIPVYNALDYVKECLRTLDETYPDRNLILVDDCSGEETKSFLQGYASCHEKTHLIQRQVRGWFTRAINSGIRYSMSQAAPWMITLNSDCLIYSEAFEEMFEVWNIATAERSRVGLVGSEGPQPQSHPRYAYKHEPDYVTGHAILLHRETLEACNINGFPVHPNQIPGANNGLREQDLIHINSDRFLSYWFNRLGYSTVVSYHSRIGHHGFKSWGAALHTIPINVSQVTQVGD